MRKKFKKVFAVLMAVMVFATLGVTMSFAADDAASEAVSAMQAGFNEVTSTISIGNVITVILAVIGVCVGFVFFWWGIRKVVRMVMAAFKKGKISV